MYIKKETKLWEGFGFGGNCAAKQTAVQCILHTYQRKRLGADRTFKHFLLHLEIPSDGRSDRTQFTSVLYLQRTSCSSCQPACEFDTVLRTMSGELPIDIAYTKALGKWLCHSPARPKKKKQLCLH